ncbi:alcohol dehydrogenase catalytic domain-containing protein [Paenibacillus alginolyticus]|uniref:zinc-binding dehydrogenase n=1 Tax=Paenibacillus alginolyticus TaxID=59839 RepID=UPI000409D01F|nr:zinc-binding dehydrogenase [Paenibacillus alginolyticus]MCY9665808.1 alcohol dehydrogenase catalytic domain-containing protein [Paenibacillus alginolyticus]
MQAVVFKQEGQFSVEDRPIPTIKNDDEVLLKVLAASICGTDVHILASPPGHPATEGKILGHEYVAEIVAIGSRVENVKVGDRVCIDPNLTCGGFCSSCKNGMPNLCEHVITYGIFEDGGFAAFNVVPARMIYPISHDVPVELAALVEPLSCVVNGCDKINVQPGQSVVVLGAGPMGQLFIQMVKAAGASKIICVDLSDYRLDIAIKSGATHTVSPNKNDIREFILKETALGVDVVIDCVGSLFDQAVSLVRPGGQVLLLGLNSHALPAVKQYDITKNEISVKGTFISKFSFAKAIHIVESGLLNLEQLITHRLPMDRIGDGIMAMRKGEALKVIIYPLDHEE